MTLKKGTSALADCQNLVVSRTRTATGLAFVFPGAHVDANQAESWLSVCFSCVLIPDTALTRGFVGDGLPHPSLPCHPGRAGWLVKDNAVDLVLTPGTDAVSLLIRSSFGAIRSSPWIRAKLVTQVSYRSNSSSSSQSHRSGEWSVEGEWYGKPACV